MTADQRFDVLVVGAGPAGSAAALVLARGGARVGLVDKATFPRDKACGDLIGPRGVQTLRDLDLERGLPCTERVGDMFVVGPNGRRVQLPSAPGLTYPDFGIVVPRTSFDAHLQHAAVEAGAVFINARADEPIGEDGLDGFCLSTGTRVRADVIVGADGATSRVSEVAGLVDPDRVLWGFAVRDYRAASINLPNIMLWTPRAGQGFPGYGWVFPAGAGCVNVGLGIGLLADRSSARRAPRELDTFVRHATAIGALPVDVAPGRRSLGSWLKMGMVGTVPARGRVLLVGDAAGLVNPLQGEGIAQALDSGRAAADAILAGVERAADRYRAHLASRYFPYLATTASLQRSLLRRPQLVAALTRTLTASPVGSALAGGWAITWNDLLDGAPPSAARTVAAAAARLGRVATAGSADRRWLRAALDGHEPTRASAVRV